MKRLRMMVIAVFLASVAVCTACLLSMNSILDQASEKATEICMHMEQGDGAAAEAGLVDLATFWEDHLGLLEVLCDHDDLHEVKEHIIEAEICARYTDMEDFYAAATLIDESVEHIRDEEALRLSNFY